MALVNVTAIARSSVLLMFVCIAAHAQESHVAVIPDALPPAVRAELATAYDALMSRIDAHNVKRDDFMVRCGHIPNAETGRIAKCVQEYQMVILPEESTLEDDKKQFAARLSAAVCFQVSQLQNQFQSLTPQIDLDRQVVLNFGFAKTVAEVEYWGNLSERQVEDAKKAFKAMLFDAILALVSEGAGAVGSLTQEEVDALYRLGDAEGVSPTGLIAGANDIHDALEFLSKTKTAYEAADDVRRGHLLDAAVKVGGLVSKNNAFGLLLTADDWAAYELYQSITAVTTVNDLTKATEADLILLKSRSERLKNEVNQLTLVKKQLAELVSKCDSTNLVKKPE
jgi:hypothetical protein